MKKIIDNQICPKYTAQLNDAITLNKNITPLELFIEHGGIEFKESSQMEKNKDIFSIFPKITKDELIDYIENVLIKKDFDSIRLFLRNNIFGTGGYSVMLMAFFKEKDLLKIVQEIGNIFLVKNKEKLANEFVGFFLTKSFNHFGFGETIYNLYKSGLIKGDYISSTILKYIITDELVPVSKEEKKTLIKPTLLCFSTELFSNNPISDFNINTVYPNISIFFNDEEIIKLATRFDFTIKYILEDKSLSQNVVEKISNLIIVFYENKIASGFDFTIDKDENRPYLLNKFIKYLSETNTIISDNSIMNLWKLSTRLKSGDEYIFGEEANTLAQKLLSMYNCPKILISEVINSKKFTYIEYLSAGNSRNLTKEDLTTMLGLNHEVITSNVMRKASQYGMDVSDILGF